MVTLVTVVTLVMVVMVVTVVTLVTLVTVVTLATVVTLVTMGIRWHWRPDGPYAEAKVRSSTTSAVASRRPGVRRYSTAPEAASAC